MNSKQIVVRTKRTGQKIKNLAVRMLSTFSKLFNDNRYLVPEKWLGVLKYIDDQYIRLNAGANYLLYNFRVNDLYDLDPLVLSGSFSGFKEAMQFYRYFRAIRGAVHFEGTNQETFGLMIGYFFSTDSLVGTVSSRNDLVNAFENAGAEPMQLVSAKGGMDKVTFDLEFDIGALILGNRRQYMTDVNYTGTISAGPAAPLYFNLGIASPSSTFLANGIVNALTFAIEAEFFGRLNLRA